MTDYQAVQKALSGGASPAMLCATCPWDRYCVSPPAMTSGEVEQKIKEASAEDDAKMRAAELAGQKPGMPTGSLLTVLMFAGKDTAAQVCPVFALRLRSGSGRRIADAVKDSMQKWDDEK